MRHMTMGIIVIAASMLLSEPWLIAMQASLGGVLVGSSLERWRVSRTPGQ